MQFVSVFSKGLLKAFYSVFYAQTLPKGALLEYICAPFSVQTANVKCVLSCWFWHGLRSRRLFQRLFFCTFSEPASKDASEAPFVQFVIDFNSDLVSRLDPIGSLWAPCWASDFGHRFGRVPDPPGFPCWRSPPPNNPSPSPHLYMYIYIYIHIYIYIYIIY